MQYRGKAPEHYAKDLRRINAPCRVIFTLRKLKTVLPSLKLPIDQLLKSKVVYQNKINEQCIRILTSTHKGESTLLTLEALWIREIRPTLNTKDEFKSRELIIQI